MRRLVAGSDRVIGAAPHNNGNGNRDCENHSPPVFANIIEEFRGVGHRSHQDSFQIAVPGVGQRQGNNALRVHVCEPNNMVGRELRVYDARADQSRFDADLRDSKPDDNDKATKTNATYTVIPDATHHAQMNSALRMSPNTAER